MKTKILLWSVVTVLVIGIAVAAIMWLNRPQVITLKDGTKLTFMGMAYGKRHPAPKIKMANGRARGGGGQIVTTNDTLVVWVLSERKGNQGGPNDQLLVYDPANTACVSAWPRDTTQIKNNTYLQGFLMEAYPRHSGKIVLRIEHWSNNRGMQQELSKGQFVISNPTRGTFPKWTPDALPDTQSDGDLNVTLTRLIYGVEGFQRGNGVPTKDPMNKAVLAAFRTEQKGVVMTNWQPYRITTSDATGNHIQNNSWSNRRDNDEAVMVYQWGLWPDEPAWKLNVEMTRTSGFNDDEEWTVQNLPLHTGSQMDLYNYQRNSRTNGAFAETTLNGVHLKIFPAIQFTDLNYGNGQKSGGVRLQVDPDPETLQMRMSLASLTDEQGHELQYWGPNGGGGTASIQIQNLRNAKSLNVTIAIHKSRFVEFMVKPTKQ
jgi:hypothetical protein